MKRRVLCLVLAVLSLALILTGCAGTGGAKQGKVKVGFVYIGSAGDKGYTFAHDQEENMLKKNSGTR